MPKRGAYRGGFSRYNNSNDDGEQRFNSHDDRTERNDRDDRNDRIESYIRNERKTDNRRRVSFKPSVGVVRNQQNQRIKANDITIRLLGEDDDMNEIVNNGTGSNNFRSNKTRGWVRQRSPIPRKMNNNPGKILIGGSFGWFRVHMPYGHKYEKQFLLKSLSDAISPQTFMPLYYKVEDTSVSFYIDDIKAGQLLLKLNRKIQMPDGYLLMVNVRNSIPSVQVNDALKETMKLAMVKRYSPATKAMDLTKFHYDTDLTDVFCALFRPTIMLAAIEILAENLPDLEALNLNDNGLHLMDHLKCLSAKLPCLKILHMANNKITSTNSLESIKNSNIIELVLDGNPVKDRIKDQTIYVSEIRKRFTKLQKLDGVLLPPEIGFDVSNSIHIPIPRASFLCDQNGADIVRKFLELYYTIYDSDSRQPLLDAYHENAMLSLTATFSHQNRLSIYLPHSRNITRIRDMDSRCRLLKSGRLPVVSFLSELPLTQHDPQSFAVDLTLFTPSLIQLTVSGIFRERDKLTTPSDDMLLRSFQRTLIIVPAGGGFCIKNEVIHINNVTRSQTETAFNHVNPTSTSTSSSSISSTLTATVESQPIPSTSTGGIDPYESTKNQMVLTMVELSKMNEKWARKCLEETNWDLQKAGHVFTELHAQQKIPAEAFIQ